MPIIENGCSSPEGANAGTWNLCVGLARDVSQHASRNLFWSVPVGDDSQRRLDIAGKSDAKLSRSPANESVQFCAEPVGSDMMATEMMMLMPQNGLVGIQFGQENRVGIESTLAEKKLVEEKRQPRVASLGRTNWLGFKIFFYR